MLITPLGIIVKMQKKVCLTKKKVNEWRENVINKVYSQYRKSIHVKIFDLFNARISFFLFFLVQT